MAKTKPATDTPQKADTHHLTTSTTPLPPTTNTPPTPSYSYSNAITGSPLPAKPFLKPDRLKEDRPKPDPKAEEPDTDGTRLFNHLLDIDFTCEMNQTDKQQNKAAKKKQVEALRHKLDQLKTLYTYFKIKRDPIFFNRLIQHKDRPECINIIDHQITFLNDLKNSIADLQQLHEKLNLTALYFEDLRKEACLQRLSAHIPDLFFHNHANITLDNIHQALQELVLDACDIFRQKDQNAYDTYEVYLAQSAPIKESWKHLNIDNLSLADYITP